MFCFPIYRLGRKCSTAAVHRIYFFVFLFAGKDSPSTEKINLWYELEFLGAFKQVDACSADDKYAFSIPNSETVTVARQKIHRAYALDWLQYQSTTRNFYSSLAQFETKKRRLSKDPKLRDRYAESIRTDRKKAFVVTVQPHCPCKQSDREWCFLHHPIVNPNKTNRVKCADHLMGHVSSTAHP